MFQYKITCGDYNLGGYDYTVTYQGTNRETAFAAYKEAKEWMGMAKADITVFGCEKKQEEPEDEEENPPCWKCGISDEVCSKCEYIRCIMHP